VRLAPFVHDLHVFGPRALGEFALHFEFAELRLIVGVGNRTGTQAVAMMPMMQFNWVRTFQIQLALKISVKHGTNFNRNGGLVPPKPGFNNRKWKTHVGT